MNTTEKLISRHIHQWNELARFIKPEGEMVDNAARRAEFARRHPPICISRDLGAGARAIANSLSRRLNYEIIGKRIIDDLAEDIGVQRQLIDSLDERSRGSLDVMFNSLISGKEIDNADYFRALVRIVRALALKGGAIFLGRGGVQILGQDAGLNVLIAGSIGARVARVMAYTGQDLENARRTVEETDRERQRFVKRHFDVDARDPANYDLCINTDCLSSDQAAELILKALELKGHPIASLRIGG